LSTSTLHRAWRRWRSRSRAPDPRRCPTVEAVALDDDVAADQGRALHRLQLHELAFRPSTVVLSFSMPLTVLICAIWLVTCALSIGLSGSWFCICVTSSFRKRSSAAGLVGGRRPLAIREAVVVLMRWRSRRSWACGAFLEWG
jgi:hypothetical protein